MKYLIVESHNLSDLPVRFFEDRSKAETYCEDYEFMGPDSVHCEMVMGDVDATEPVSLRIITFDDQGILRGCDTVRDYDSENEQSKPRVHTEQDE